MSTDLLVKHLPGAAFKPPVQVARLGDAGLDLHFVGAALVQLEIGRSAVLSCGIAIKIPWGCYGMIKARSSTFSKRGLFIVDGIIDSGYTGELFINVWHPGLLRNGSNELPNVIEITPGERLAQLVIMQFQGCNIVEVQELPETDRGTSGFGSTGA